MINLSVFQCIYISIQAELKIQAEYVDVSSECFSLGSYLKLIRTKENRSTFRAKAFQLKRRYGVKCTFRVFQRHIRVLLLGSFKGISASVLPDQVTGSAKTRIWCKMYFSGLSKAFPSFTGSDKTRIWCKIYFSALPVVVCGNQSRWKC
jgi:hypothetical protein